MTVTPFDSALYGASFSDADIARLFSDGAVVRAMLLAEGALARAQAAEELIPGEAAEAIHRTAMEAAIDPAALAQGTAANGIPVPSLVAAFRREMPDPALAQWIHHGATSQDIVDTGLALRLRRVLEVLGTRLDAVLAMLARLARDHAETAMAARTYGQVATPTSFGALAAIWGAPFLSLRDGLPDLRDRVCVVTLNGAAGTLSAMGPAGPKVRARMAAGLGLGDPGAAPHAERSHMRALTGWTGEALAACDKVSTDLLLMTREGEVRLGGGGASSTMPQKVNPVAPAQVHALALHGRALAGAMGTHWDMRDGGAWFAEWLALPQMLVAAGRAMQLLADAGIDPDAGRLRARADDPTGLIHAEALSFDLPLPRPEAQAQVKELAAQVRAKGGNLVALAGLDPADYAPETRWGEAPALALRFAKAVEG